MARIEARVLDDEQAVTVLETIGDTPVHGIFVDGELAAVTPRYGPGWATPIVAALMARDDHDALTIPD